MQDAHRLVFNREEDAIRSFEQLAQIPLEQFPFRGERAPLRHLARGENGAAHIRQPDGCVARRVLGQIVAGLANLRCCVPGISRRLSRLRRTHQLIEYRFRRTAFAALKGTQPPLDADDRFGLVHEV